ncbi:MAG TPA: RNase adapter RapZ [Micavibrio sp.]|nr:RNase adapter RapZ [Micavibrio sp.]
MTRPLLFITGLSGAGMSSALKILEDLGYEVFDNFPLSLIDDLLRQDCHRPVAIGIDTRTRGFDPQAIIAKAKTLGAKLLLITCDETVLQKRFSETRRKHPLAGDRPASAGIKKELGLLYDFREVADSIIDTTELTIHDLRRVLTGLYGENKGGKLNVTVMSFGFKNGLPREADIVMDCRFLANPHWEEKLKPLTGKDAPVQNYVGKDVAFRPFFKNLQTLLEPLLDGYAREGKSYLTIALGCTGGKHRSVFVAEKLREWLQQKAVPTSVEHRDINRC